MAWETRRVPTAWEQVPTVTTEQRQGTISSLVVTSSVSNRTDTRTSAIPFMRRRTLMCSAVMLKPNTEMNFFIDGKNVNDKVIPALNVVYDSVAGSSATKQSPIMSKLMTPPTIGVTSMESAIISATGNMRFFDANNFVLTVDNSISANVWSNNSTPWVGISMMLMTHTSGAKVLAYVSALNLANGIYKDVNVLRISCSNQDAIAVAKDPMFLTGVTFYNNSGVAVGSGTLQNSDLTSVWTTRVVQQTSASWNQFIESNTAKLLGLSNTVRPFIDSLTINNDSMVTIQQTKTDLYDQLEHGTPVTITRAGSQVGTAVVVAQEYEQHNGINVNVAKLVVPTTTLQAGDIVSSSNASFQVVSTFETGRKTNSMGNFYGLLIVDGGTYKTGTVPVQITDASTYNGPEEVTAAQTTYSATGTLTESWNVNVTTFSTTEVRTGTSESRQVQGTQQGEAIAWEETQVWVPDPIPMDPIAQSFYVDDASGIYVSGITLYFNYVEQKYPVAIEIREMVNGYPGPKVINNGRTWLPGTSVSYSLTEKIPTKFTFPELVYLVGGKSYCFVVRTESNQTRIWTSKVGDQRIDAPSYVVTQPTLGGMFKSQNNETWTSDDWSDITFILEKAKFDISKEGEIALVNSELSWDKLGYNPFLLKDGSSTALVYHNNHGFANGDIVEFRGSTDSRFDISATVSNVTPDNYEIQIESTANVVNLLTRVGGANVEASKNVTVNMINLVSDEVVPTGTDVHYHIAVSSGRTISDDLVEIIANKDVFLTTGAELLSVKNEKRDLGDKKALAVHAFMNSNNSNISPTLDLSTLSAAVVNYDINSPSHGYGYSHLDESILSAQTVNFDETNKKFSVTDSNLEDEFARFVVGRLIKIEDIAGGLTYTTYVKKVSIDTNTSECVVTFTDSVPLNGAKSVNVIQNSHLVNDFAPEGTSSNFQYVSKIMSLNFDATGFKIMFDYIKPANTQIKVYYKVTGDDAISLKNDIWEEHIPEGNTVLIDTDGMVEGELNIEASEAFKHVMFKLVMTSSDQAKTPLIKNLRFIALA